MTSLPVVTSRLTAVGCSERTNEILCQLVTQNPLRLTSRMFVAAITKARYRQTLNIPPVLIAPFWHTHNYRLQKSTNWLHDVCLSVCLFACNSPRTAKITITTVSVRFVQTLRCVRFVRTLKCVRCVRALRCVCSDTQVCKVCSDTQVCKV